MRRQIRSVYNFPDTRAAAAISNQSILTCTHNNAALCVSILNQISKHSPLIILCVYVCVFVVLVEYVHIYILHRERDRTTNEPIHHTGVNQEICKYAKAEQHRTQARGEQQNIIIIKNTHTHTLTSAHTVVAAATAAKPTSSRLLLLHLLQPLAAPSSPRFSPPCGNSFCSTVPGGSVSHTRVPFRLAHHTHTLWARENPVRMRRVSPRGFEREQWHPDIRS